MFYFTKDTDIAIVKFLQSTSDTEKHQIFTEQIKPAFDKLIENLIYTYGFYNIDDVDTLKRDCLANLYEMIPKYNVEKSTKGFSYFNVVAKNWFIQKTREKNRRGRLESELHYDLDHEIAKSDSKFSITPHEDDIINNEFWLEFYHEIEFWKYELVKKSERQVLDAIIFLLKNPALVSIYNKKAIYLYLRELTGLNTKQVITNLKKIKNLYVEWKVSYFDDEGF